MASDFKVYLLPTKPEEEEEVLEFSQVDLGFNQLGWLLLTDSNRDVVAAFTPGTVRYARQTRTNGEIIEVEAKEIVVN